MAMKIRLDLPPPIRTGAASEFGNLMLSDNGKSRSCILFCFWNEKENICMNRGAPPQAETAAACVLGL